MYEKFILNDRDRDKGDHISIMGYHWKLEDPSHVVVLVHGIGEYAGRFDRVAEFFKNENIAMIGMDLRGHGYSEGKRGHTSPRKAVLSDIDRLIEYTQISYPNTPIVIYGHSMGGNITLDYRKRGALSDKPVGYLVTAPWIILEKKIPSHLYLFVKLMSKIKPDFQISSDVRMELLGNMEIISKETNRQMNHGKITLATAIDCFDAGEALMRGTLKKSGCGEDKPLLLMHGTSDQICSVEGSRKIDKIEGEYCRYIEWPNLLHEIHNGNATEDGENVILAMIEGIKKF